MDPLKTRWQASLFRHDRHRVAPTARWNCNAQASIPLKLRHQANSDEVLQ
jgi:hypothetical protein